MKKKVQEATQYAHDVVLTSMQRRFNVMDVVWTSKGRCLFIPVVQGNHPLINIHWRFV